MAGSLWKTGKNKWKLCVSLGYDITGKRVRKYKKVTAEKKKDAEKLLAEFITECEKYNVTKYESTLFKNFYFIWMRDYAEKRLRKKTISRYKTLWPRVEKCLGHFEIGNIRPSHLIQFYNILEENGIRLDGKFGGLAPTTIRHHHTLISTILETAVTWEYIQSNPCSKVKLSRLGLSERALKQKKDEEIYTIEETKVLLKRLNLAEIKYKTFINLAIFTGGRREELLGLEWTDINFDTGEIRFERSIQYTPFDGTYEDDLKNDHSRRNCFIPEEIVLILQEYYDWWCEERERGRKKGNWIESNKLFVRKNGDFVHPDTMTKWFNKFLKKEELKHTCLHNLRHVHCSILVADKMDFKSIADQLGHADMQMLITRYSHGMTKNSREVADRMKGILLDG